MVNAYASISTQIIYKDYIIRPATVSDVNDVVHLRRVMFEAMGYTDPDQYTALEQIWISYFTEKLHTGEYRGWLVFCQGKDNQTMGNALASGGFVIDHHPPSIKNPSGNIGYIMNVITLESYRGQGIATQIMLIMMDWLKSNQITQISLHATDMGAPIYEKIGFRKSNLMEFSFQSNLV